MPEFAHTRRGEGGSIQTLASFVLVVACLYWAQKILIPVALAVLLTLILSPLQVRLQRLGLGRILSVIVVVAGAFALLGGACWAIAAQLRSLLDELPLHRDEIAAKLKNLQGDGTGPLSNLTAMVGDIFAKLRENSLPLFGGQEPQPVVVVQDRLPSLSWVASAAGTAAEAVLSVLFTGILVVFMLARRENLRDRFFRAVGSSRLAVLSRALDTAAQRISSYLRTQLLINVTLGLAWSVCLVLVPDGAGGRGVPYPLLWGVMLAALRFVPYLGGVMAVMPPLLMSVALSPAGHVWLQPLLIVAAFAVLEFLAANVVEPLLFGRNTGVSPLALLIAAVFWAWLWGPIGLVLSTPLTVCLVVLGKSVPELSLLHQFFGPDPVSETEASYYQRLLVHDEDEAAEIVHAHLKDHPPDSVYDELLVPALALARRDEGRGSLEPGDERFILEATRRVVNEVVGPERVAVHPAEEADSTAPDERPLVLACPAQGEADELILDMLAQALGGGPVTEVVSAKTLASEVVERVGEEQPAVACISALAPGGLARACYLCKRLRLHHPGLRILVGRWGQNEDEDRMKARLTEAGATKVVTSLTEMKREILPLLPLQAPAAEVRAAVPVSGSV